MKISVLMMTFLAACAVIAGGSFLTAKADTLEPGMHIDPEGAVASSKNGLTACYGAHQPVNMGKAKAGQGDAKVYYKVHGNGTTTLQVLGGAYCCPTNALCGGVFRWAGTIPVSSNKWTSSGSLNDALHFTSATICSGASPFAVYAACRVAEF